MTKIKPKSTWYYLLLPNLTKPNLRSRAPNPAGASTHTSLKYAGLCYVFQNLVKLARFAGTRLT